MKLKSISILDGLNDPQQQAVTTTEGPLLVVAGPGTGKTLTIVRRIAWLVQKGVPPENILAVTFTNRAAREMKERAEALVGDACSRMFIGTFHLLGLRIIRENRGTDFSICGREEQVQVLKSVMRGTGKTVQQTAEKISRIKNFLEEAINPPLPSNQNDPHPCPSPLEGEGKRERGLYSRGNVSSPPLEKGDRGGLPEPQDIRNIYDAYQAALAQKNVVDFDDLIRVPIEMLQNHATADKYRKRFTHVIVDEYQDINSAQYKLLVSIVGKGENVCAVGDSDQAIYSFRGADLRNFLNFERDFPGATRVTLTSNYRSTQAIVKAADGVIKNNQHRIEKPIAAAGKPGSALSVISVQDDRAEGAAIIAEIEDRMGGMDHEGARAASSREPAGTSYRFSDFAVIYRTNAQVRSLEEAFSASGIPFQVIGKPSSIQRKEAEETLAFLRSLANAEGPGQDRKPQSSAEALLLTEADFFDPRADAVTLMTMHMAKGLEFRVVFIAGCEDGLVPCAIIDDDPDIEEERRLFYVGMTRAREELFLIHARSRFLYGQSLGGKRSRFIKEIPAELIESRTIADRVKKEKPEDRQLGLF